MQEIADSTQGVSEDSTSSWRDNMAAAKKKAPRKGSKAARSASARKGARTRARKKAAKAAARKRR
jgi:hypothetical protein